jgi:hypothetical protein
MSQVQADMYIARCYNKPYFEHPLGQKIGKVTKWIFGASLLVCILTLIIGPMFLFSSINPASVPNPVVGGSMSFIIHVDDKTANTKNDITLFSTK